MPSPARFSSIVAWTLVAAFASASARAGAPLKVLGRGMENRRTHQVLQIACVGDRLDANSSERSCRRLQFLLTELSGEAKLVGPTIRIENDRKLKRQLKEQLRQLGLYEAPRSKGVLVLQAIAIGGSAALFPPFALAIIGVGVGVTALTALVHPDNRRVMGLDPRILNSRRLSTAQDRSSAVWSIAPKKVGAKKFDRLLGRLTAIHVGPAEIDAVTAPEYAAAIEEVSEAEAEAMREADAGSSAPILFDADEDAEE